MSEEGKIAAQNPANVNMPVSQQESIEQPSTSNIQPQTEEMEVHHAKAEKKNFKEYFFEFLMVFLAVTMGFFAENLREHFDNRDEEKEYISSLNEDLKLDTLNLTISSLSLQEKVMQLDSLVLLLNKIDSDSSHINDIYFYARCATRKTSFHATDRTLTELENSGAFELLTNNQLIENLMEYEQQVNFYNINTYNDVQERELLYPFVSKIFDAYVFHTMVDNDAGSIMRPVGTHTLKNLDKEYINQFIYYLHLLKSSFIIEKKTLDNLKEKAVSTIQLIKKDYYQK